MPRASLIFARMSRDTEPAAGGSFPLPPSLVDLEKMAEEALASIPAELLTLVGDLLIQIEDFPDEDTEREMGLDSPFDLLGLYRGVDMTRQSVMDLKLSPDMVYLYRRPILDYWCESGEELPHIVRHVLIHEIGHHFGFSDDDMDRIEALA